jgi:hypothetical protein
MICDVCGGLGTQNANVTLLKIATIHDIKHLDLEPLSVAELARKIGPNRDSRRIAIFFIWHAFPL